MPKHVYEPRARMYIYWNPLLASALSPFYLTAQCRLGEYNRSSSTPVSRYNCFCGFRLGSIEIDAGIPRLLLHIESTFGILSPTEAAQNVIWATSDLGCAACTKQKIESKSPTRISNAISRQRRSHLRWARLVSFFDKNDRMINLGALMGNGVE